MPRDLGDPVISHGRISPPSGRGAIASVNRYRARCRLAWVGRSSWSTLGGDCHHKRSCSESAWPAEGAREGISPRCIQPQTP